MSARVRLSVLAFLCAAAPAVGGTKLSMNFVSSPPDCAVGPSVCLNSGAGCSFDNSECALAGVSSKSKVSLDGKLALKASFKDVKDNAGLLVTTGPVGAVDNYVLQAGLQTCTVDVIEIPYCSADQNVYVKVVLSEGKGSVSVDLKPVFPSFASGSAFRVNHVALITPRGGGSCLGTNATLDLATRLNDSTCNDGVGILGVGGVALQ